MKKKVLIIIFFAFVLFFNTEGLNAANTCTKPTYESGKVKIKWNNDKMNVAKTSVNRCDGESKKQTYKSWCSSQDACVSACNKVHSEQCTTTQETDKDSGYSNCTVCDVTAETKKWQEAVVDNSKCDYYEGDSCPSDYKQVGENFEHSVYCCKIKGYETKTSTNLYYSFTKTTFDYSKCKWKAGESTVNAAKYVMTQHAISSKNWENAGNDVTYCLQPGNKGPTTEQEYVLDSTFDIANCKDALHQKSGAKDVRCGLAHILYQTVDEVNGEYVSNGRYDYGAITYALRMWMAEYAKDYGTFELGNSLLWNGEFDTIKWVTKDNYYKKTADAALDGTYNSKVSEVKKTLGSNGTVSDEYKGILYCSGNTDCSISKAIELLQSAYRAAFVDTSTFLKGKEFSSDVTEYKTYKSSRNEITTEVKIKGELGKNRECSESDVASGNCYVKVEYFDEKGNNITNKVNVTGYCEKEFCQFKANTINLCEGEANTKVKVRINIEGLRKNIGYIRFYTHASDPANRQKMITFAFKLEKCDNESNGVNYVESEPIETTCTCPKGTCDNLETKIDLPTSYSTGEYTKGSVIDPSMSCILNSCYESDKSKFDYSDKYNVNKDVCRIYCRDEIEFYLPGKTATYAGMQFSYDLGNILKREGILSQTVSGNSSSPKLTGVVVNKRQCISKINYDYWYDEYNRIKNNKKEITLTEDPIYSCEMDLKEKVECPEGGEYNKTTKKCEYDPNGSNSNVKTYCKKKADKNEVCKYYKCTSTTNPSVVLWQTKNCSKPCSSSGASYYAKETVYSTTYSCPSNEAGLSNIEKSGKYCYAETNGTECPSGWDLNSEKGNNGHDYLCKSIPTHKLIEGKCSYDATKTKYCPEGTEEKGNKCYSSGKCSGEGKTIISCKTSGYTYNETTKKCEKKEYLDNSELVNQWVYNIYNCNLYSSKDIPSSVKNYTHATPVGTSKDLIISQATCTTSDCMNLTVNYEDSTYGNNNVLSKLSKILNSDANKTYYCKDSDSKKCYEYNAGVDNEINGSNSTVNLDYISGKIPVPNNTYATITLLTESDFYQSKQYQTEAYSGKVTIGDGSDSTQIPLAENSYPVSHNTATGEYDIIFTFTKLPFKSIGDTYKYTSKYQVYNTTVLYDCSMKDENGNVDLTKCSNDCYEVKNGVPVIKSSCMNWEISNKKQYGFVYRTVELNNLFPNAVIDKKGISTRKGRTNWSEKQEIIKEIQKSASTIFTNDEKYLEARYVLTPQSIQEIKEYNRNETAKGGYYNNTLVDCEKVKEDDTYLFKNCKSTFLKEIKNYTGVQVGEKKGGVN